MKKLLLAAIAIVAALCLFSCGGEGKKEEETTVKTDWRNTIEYEGAFFVNESKRVLYALDTGSITVWDNAGDGKVLQVIEYDTSVADAIERIEKEDFNNDGNCDIRVIYSENERGKRYNLFLWSEKTGRFAECQLYNTINNPVYNEETGYVTGITDLGIYGKATVEYAFNENSGLDKVSASVEGLEDIAKMIATSIGGDSFEDTGYVSKNGNRIAKISHNSEFEWFVDMGCIGLYRKLEESEGAVVIGDYIENAKPAYELIKLLKGEDAKFTGTTLGVIRNLPAQSFEAVDGEGNSFSVVTDENGLWYFSEDGVTFVQVLSATGEVAGEEEYEFTNIF